ncbi:methyltransferase, FxLD system [Streptomyces sp. NPDC093249]|uniref:methyltransferase, FxLD system n=1 Tax=unclassified Streptomyces TaxID=2593676 RepID=UPI003450DEE6
MPSPEWPQRLIDFARPSHVENDIAQRLLPLLEADGAFPRWSFIRKAPAWRLRFEPSAASALLDEALDRLTDEGLVRAWYPGLYEPETTAFGGPAAMDVAHDLFHHDSLHSLTANTVALGCRELGILLPSVAMRAAGLDLFEQGDVWAKVCEMRPTSKQSPHRLEGAVRRLMTVDVSPTSAPVKDGRLAHLADWIAAFDRAGRALADLNRHGHLRRGLRAILAHHVIFHWNRLGLVSEDQSALSTLAREAVMSTSETPTSTPDAIPPTTTVPGVNSTPDTSTDTLRAAYADGLVARGKIRSKAVEDAMRTVPRHLFVPHVPHEKAYANTTVNTKLDPAGRSISCASQPDIIAMMLEQMQVEPGANVLELGAGTGYNAALLAHLVGDSGHVTTIDVDADIVDGAREALAAAGTRNVTVVLGDGAKGYPDNAPYDLLELTVGAHGLPPELLDQIAPTGRVLAPLRVRGGVSRSIAFERDGATWRSLNSEMNTFMPLRNGMADDPRQFIALTDDASVTLVVNGDQTADADMLNGVLARPRAETWTGVTLRGAESPEWLELWLACSLPNSISHMPAKPHAAGSGLLTNAYPSATATFDGETLTYLTRRKSERTAPDGSALYEFGVIGHGPDAEALAEKVAAEIRTWDERYRARPVAFTLLPADGEPIEQGSGQFVVATGFNRLVVTWQ